MSTALSVCLANSFLTLFFFWGEPKWKASVVVVLRLISVCHAHRCSSTGQTIPWYQSSANSAFHGAGAARADSSPHALSGSWCSRMDHAVFKMPSPPIGKSWCRKALDASHVFLWHAAPLHVGLSDQLSPSPATAEGCFVGIVLVGNLAIAVESLRSVPALWPSNSVCRNWP